jgi:hypothetical protein
LITKLVTGSDDLLPLIQVVFKLTAYNEKRGFDVLFCKDREYMIRGACGGTIVESQSNEVLRSIDSRDELTKKLKGS